MPGDDPPRRRPTVLGAEVPSLRPPGESDRLHDEHESRSSEDFAARERRRQQSNPRLDGDESRRTYPHVVHESYKAPPSGRRGIQLPSGSPWYAYILVAVISSGGTGGLLEAIRGKGESDQIQELRAELRRHIEDDRRQTEDVREIRDYIRRDRRVDEDRWDLQNAFNCKINSGPWIREVECHAVDFEPLPLNAAYAGPKLKARGEWPRASRAP